MNELFWVLLIILLVWWYLGFFVAKSIAKDSDLKTLEKLNGNVFKIAWWVLRYGPFVKSKILNDL